MILVLQKVLAAHGATKVSAYVTHAVFPKNSWEKFTHKNGGKYISFSLSLMCVCVFTVCSISMDCYYVQKTRARDLPTFGSLTHVVLL